MRDLKRNQQTVYYRLYEGQVEIKDDYGNATGTYDPKYSDKLESTLLCVSPNSGSASVYIFGSMTDYDRTMTTANIACEINENAILWLDGADVNGPHNYIVKKRAPWKNSVAFAIKQVNVSY